MNNLSYEGGGIMSTAKGSKYILSERSLDQMSNFFKVMSDKTRLRILETLLGGSMCVMHISERVGMSQSAISHQLAILRKADLVRVKRSGKSVLYSISDDHVRLMLDMALIHVNEEGTYGA
jgi:ArsR family transcriptional regulator